LRLTNLDGDYFSQFLVNILKPRKQACGTAQESRSYFVV